MIAHLHQSWLFGGPLGLPANNEKTSLLNVSRKQDNTLPQRYSQLLSFEVLWAQELVCPLQSCKHSPMPGFHASILPVLNMFFSNIIKTAMVSWQQVPLQINAIIIAFLQKR